MRKRVFITSVLSCTGISRSISGNPGAAESLPQMKLALWKLECSSLVDLSVDDAAHASPAYVVGFENTGNAPLRLMSFNNGYGYRNLFFEVKSGAVSESIFRKPRSFRRNLPFGFITQSNRTAAIPVSLMPSIWDQPKAGWDKVTAIRAIYVQEELKLGKEFESINFDHQWIGKAISDWFEI